MYKSFNNFIANQYWEGKLPRGYNRPGPNSTPNEVEKYIRDKYINRLWIDSK